MVNQNIEGIQRTCYSHMETVQPFEPTMIRCKFELGAHHLKDGKLEKGDIAQEQKTQLNHVNALSAEDGCKYP